MNITKITISRLFNLGNYEHARYELTCEVPGGESPAKALTGLERIIDCLNPKFPDGAISVQDEKRRLSEMAVKQMLGDEDFARRYLYMGNCTRDEYMQREMEDLQDRVARRQEWEHRSAEARKLLDDLGGAAIWRDAKMGWDSD